MSRGRSACGNMEPTVKTCLSNKILRAPEFTRPALMPLSGEQLNAVKCWLQLLERSGLGMGLGFMDQKHTQGTDPHSAQQGKATC